MESIFKLFELELSAGTEVFSRFLRSQDVQALLTPFEDADTSTREGGKGGNGSQVGGAPAAFDPFVGTGSNAGFGRLIGWGTGAEHATAPAASITLQEVQAAGITRQVAQHWLDFYQGAVATGRGAATAAERVKLMQRVIELLGG